MDKRLKLLKLIINSDDKGIEAIWNSLYGKKKPPFSKEDFFKSSANVFVDMVSERAEIVLISNELAKLVGRMAKELFKEEK